MTGHTAIGHAVYPALHQAVGNPRIRMSRIDGNRCSARHTDKLARSGVNFYLSGHCRVEGRWRPIIGLTVLLVPKTEKTESHSKVQGLSRVEPIIVLDVGLCDAIAIVVFVL